jgi:hypothetical protein
MYVIMGHYLQKTPYITHEEISMADDKAEAVRLLAVYRAVFGPDWTLYIVEVKTEE